MKVFNRFRITFLVIASMALLGTGCGEASSSSQSTDSSKVQADDNQYDEVQMGQEVFDQLKAKVEIIKSSPLYDYLNPVSDSVAPAAQPQYNYPFKFHLVHEAQANAFSVPGGNIFVTDSLLYVAKNKEELAGVLCHEVSHTITHDTTELMKKREDVWKRQVAADLLLGKSRGRVLAIAFLGHLHNLGYSRDVEERADLNGADTCAAAGLNPWGLIWFFQDFENADKEQLPEMLSDHPDFKHRIEALEKHFKENPSVFGKFNPDRQSGTPFSVPGDAPVVFLR